MALLICQQRAAAKKHKYHSAVAQRNRDQLEKQKPQFDEGCISTIFYAAVRYDFKEEARMQVVRRSSRFDSLGN